MKVLHILNNLNFSGAEVMLYSAEKIFRNAGIKTSILSTGKVDTGPFAEKMKEIGVEIIHVPYRKNFGHFLAIRQYLIKEKFDVIHLHKEQAFIWTALAAWFPLRKTKIIRTIHNNFHYKGYLKLRRKIHHWIARRILGVKFISISSEVMENEKNLYHTQSTIINNWTDTDRFNMVNHRTKDDLEKTGQAFVSVGECSVVKNHKALIRLLKILKDKGIAFQYIHLGHGPLENEEKEFARELGVSDQVVFLGKSIKVDKHLSLADYYLMPSLREGLSISCAEAMSSGKVCIVNNVPGLQGMIIDHETGFLVDFSNLEEVAETLIEVHNNPALKKRVAENARNYVIEHFSLTNVKKQIELYV
jgi:glycosyltransferase involved in cell wall biosynthesis